MKHGSGGASAVALPPLRTLKGLRGLLENKVGIVTGASHGIGEAAALAMVEAGAKVALAARNKVALEGVERRLGVDCALAVVTDVIDPSSVKRLVDSTVERFGRLDFAFNDAGDGHFPAPLAEVALEDFQRALSVNATGTFLCMKYEVPAILRAGSGSIVNMSSTAGLQGVEGIAGYVAGKHAVIGLTKTAALDYARQGVRVNAIAPGPIVSERIASPEIRERASLGVPIGRVGDREEVAAVATWLCSDLSSFLTGAVIPVDGGRTAGVAFPRPDVTRAVTAKISGQPSTPSA